MKYKQNYLAIAALGIALLALTAFITDFHIESLMMALIITAAVFLGGTWPFIEEAGPLDNFDRWDY